MPLQRLSIDLPDGMTAELCAAVDSGEYASASAAVQEAVQFWSERRSGFGRDADHFREAWDAGKASGPHGSLDLGELREEARSRLGEASAT